MDLNNKQTRKKGQNKMQNNTIGKHKTKIFINQEGIKCVKYHDTVVFKLDLNNKHIVLNSGGYHTNTTKSRINQSLNNFGFNNIKVFQKAYEWYISINNIINPIEFQDNIIIDF